MWRSTIKPKKNIKKYKPDIKMEGQDTKTCETCSYYHHDGFCTYHLTYWNKEHTCPKWTNETLEVDYDFLYRLCKQYIKICGMYNSHEKAMEKYPEEKKYAWMSTSNYDFFLQCCLNDMKRELSRWTLKK